MRSTVAYVPTLLAVVPEVPYMQLVHADICPVLYTGYRVLPPPRGLQCGAGQVNQQAALTIGYSSTTGTQEEAAAA